MKHNWKKIKPQGPPVPAADVCAMRDEMQAKIDQLLELVAKPARALTVAELRQMIVDLLNDEISTVQLVAMDAIAETMAGNADLQGGKYRAWAFRKVQRAEHFVRAARHLMTAVAQIHGYQAADGEDHPGHALTRVAMGIANRDE